MEFLPEPFRTGLAFLVVLGVLVFFHELGHYLAARWRGVHVDAFSIGFGKPIARWTDRVGTEWRIAWLPLGGYVKLHGHEKPEDMAPEERAALREGRTFQGKSVGSRAIVVAAGPIANFILAAVLFALLFGVWGQPVGNTLVGAVVPDSAAAQAGMEKGDTILSLDGVKVSRFEQVQQYIQPRAGQAVRVVVARDGQDVDLTVTPQPHDGEDGQKIGLLGIQGGPSTLKRLNPAEAVVAGVEQTGSVTWQTLTGIGQMIVGERSARDLGGPIRIAEVSGQAASLGVAPLINLMALLSVSLALLNLFPIPMLDGGHLLFYFFEWVRGRPLPERAQEYGFRAGFALLLTLFVFASWNDIAHGPIGRWVAGLIG